MKQEKGKAERNLTISDVDVISSLYGAGVKSLEEVLGEILIVFERIFQNMQGNPYFAQSFSYAFNFSLKAINKSDGRADFQSYEGEIKKLARQYGVNYHELISNSQLQVTVNPGELEECVESDESAKKILEKGKSPKKTRAKSNETCRVRNLLDLLGREFKSGGVDSEKFKEVYESYRREIILLQLMDNDVSGYPIDIDLLKEKFGKRALIVMDVENSPINYTRPAMHANIEVLS